MEEKSTMSWGFIIIIFLFFTAFTGDGLFGNRGYGRGVENGIGAAELLALTNANNCGRTCYDVSNCEVEKQTIVNTASTQNLINTQAEATRSQATSLYIQDQAEKMFDLKINAQTTAILQGQELAKKDAEIYALKSERHTDARFNQVLAEIGDIRCNMLPAPKLYGQAFYCNGVEIPS